MRCRTARTTALLVALVVVATSTTLVCVRATSAEHFPDVVPRVHGVSWHSEADGVAVLERLRADGVLRHDDDGTSLPLPALSHHARLTAEREPLGELVLPPSPHARQFGGVPSLRTQRRRHARRADKFRRASADALAAGRDAPQPRVRRSSNDGRDDSDDDAQHTTIALGDGRGHEHSKRTFEGNTVHATKLDMACTFYYVSATVIFCHDPITGRVASTQDTWLTVDRQFDHFDPVPHVELVVQSPTDPKRLYFLARNMSYWTDDGGAFHKDGDPSSANYHPHASVLDENQRIDYTSPPKFNPSAKLMQVGFLDTTQELFVIDISERHGGVARFVSAAVEQFLFCNSGEQVRSVSETGMPTTLPTTVPDERICLIRRTASGSRLLKTDKAGVFLPVLPDEHEAVWMVNHFALFFVLVHDTSVGERHLYISNENDLKRDSWMPAMLPRGNRVRYFSPDHILDFRPGKLLLAVDNEDGYSAVGHATVYVSDGTHYRFAEVSRDIVSTNGEFDFMSNPLISGYYFANELFNAREEHLLSASSAIIKSKLSRDGGSSWQQMDVSNVADIPHIRHVATDRCTAAAADASGANATCVLNVYGYSAWAALGQKELCALHFDDRAVGLMMATGSHEPENQFSYNGLSIDPGELNTYFSRDGGHEWSIVYGSPTAYRFGLHGAVVLFVDLELTNQFHWSTDELQTQSSSPITDEKFVPWEIDVFDSASSAFTIMADEDENFDAQPVYWVLNFYDIHKQGPTECKDSDFDEWKPDDAACTLGQRITYNRRKIDSFCWPAEDHSTVKSAEVCECTVDDFECDYGYELVRPGLCAREYHEPPCQHGESEYVSSKGWRVTPQDVCANATTVTERPLGVAKQCPQSQSSGKWIVLGLVIFIIACAAGLVMYRLGAKNEAVQRCAPRFLKRLAHGDQTARLEGQGDVCSVDEDAELYDQVPAGSTQGGDDDEVRV